MPYRARNLRPLTLSADLASPGMGGINTTPTSRQNLEVTQS